MHGICIKTRLKQHNP